MRIYLHDQPYAGGPSVLALGMFDGVHAGHAAVLKTAVGAAEYYGLSMAAVSFRRHPLQLLDPEAAPKLLTDVGAKALLIRDYRADALVLLRFDRDFASLSPEEYLRFLKEKYAARCLVMGQDHRFGRDGSGNPELARQLCEKLDMKLFVVPPEEYEGEVVSSTRIRQALLAGEMEKAKQMSKHKFWLSGPIVHGKGLGRGFGFPTINVRVAPEMLLPRYGVYGAQVYLNGKYYRAVCNVGVRPTLQGEAPSVEAYLLDFKGDVYGSRASVILFSFYRPEMCFSSTKDLQAQVFRDIARAERELDYPF